MKILFLSPYTELDKRNAESVHVREVTENLAKLGNQVFLVTNDPHDARVGVKNTRQEFVSVKGKGLARFVKCTLAGFLKGAELMRKEKIDVVYERHYPLGIGVLLSKWFGAASVVEVNGLVSDEARLSPSFFKRLLSVFWKLEFVVSGKADRIIAVTDEIKRQLEKSWHIPGYKTIAITNGVNTHLFKPQAPHRGKEKTICFIGSFAPWQGVEYLIDAAPLVVKKLPKARFLLVGDGPMKKELQERAAKRGVADLFSFTGSKPYEEIPKYIGNADVCVSLKKPLKSGYSPLKLYEYLACAKPVIATRTTGFEEIEEQKLGILVNPEEPHEVAAALVKILSNPALARQMGLHGRRFVEREHSWEAVSKKVDTVCKKAVISPESGQCSTFFSKPARRDELRNNQANEASFPVSFS